MQCVLLFQPTLEVLNVSGNHLDSIIELCGMTKLTQFMASDNSLTDMREVTHCLGAWQRMSRLDLIGNPLCHKAKYRDRIIIIASSLGELWSKWAKQLYRIGFTKIFHRYLHGTSDDFTALLTTSLHS